jgi:hypothetical protein
MSEEETKKAPAKIPVAEYRSMDEWHKCARYKEIVRENNFKVKGLNKK